MIFNSNSNDFKKCVELTGRFVNKQAPMPVLHNILIEHKDNRVVFTASDLLTSARCELTLDSEKNNESVEGAVTVEAAPLMAFVKNIKPNTDCIFSFDGKFASANIDGGKANFNAVEREQYPEFTWESENENTVFEGTAGEFAHILDSTLISLGSEDRPALACVLFDLKSRDIAATNGFSLSVWSEVMFEHDIDTEVENFKSQRLVPGKGMSKIKTLLNAAGRDATVTALLESDNFMLFRIRNAETSDIDISVQLTDAMFPDYRRIIPGEPAISVQLDCKEFNRQLKNAKIFASGNSLVTLSIDGDQCIIESESNDSGTWTGEMQTYRTSELVKDSGTQIKISFNVEYLLDITAMLKANTIILWLTQPNRSLRDYIAERMGQYGIHLHCDANDIRTLGNVFMIVEKRDGSLCEFNAGKIEQSILQLLLANNFDSDRDSSLSVLHCRASQRASAITREFMCSLEARDRYHVETIQDCVVAYLRDNVSIVLAERYLKYRLEHESVRNGNAGKNDLIDNAINKTALKAIRRMSGTVEALSLQEGFLKYNIEKMVAKNLIDNNHGDLEILDSLVFVSRQFMEKDPVVFSRMAAVFLHYRTLLEFGMDDSCRYSAEDVCSFMNKLCLNIVESNDLYKKLAEVLNEADAAFEYPGLQIVYDRYLRRSKSGKLLETPEMMFMRVALGVVFSGKSPNVRQHMEGVERSILYYRTMRSFKYMPSTPTLFNAGTDRQQLASCFLTSVPDSLDGIFEAIRENALLSKYSGGLGNAWSKIRGLGAHIHGTNGKSSGVIPWLNIADATALAVNQGGKRKGAVCAYLEPWHIDIEDFLDLRKNTGDDRRRTPDMHTALWVPDAFMRAVKNNEPWYLFSPDEHPDLPETYGEKFNKAYLKAVQDYKAGKPMTAKTVSAQKLWKTIIQRIYETGHPWLTFKDRCNEFSPQAHCGMVHSSNLCTEITLNTSESETAVCNLGSINLFAHMDHNSVVGNYMDHVELTNTAHIAVNMLNDVIDATFYSTEKARRSNQMHRPIGLGMMGWADVLFTMGLPYESGRAMTLMSEIMRTISTATINKSATMAQDYGRYQSFQGSNWSKGLTPHILSQQSGHYDDVNKRYNITVSEQALAMDRVVMGMRNSNLLAVAPTATIANICGVYSSWEPQYSCHYAKTNMSGNFIFLNKYLFRELKHRNLWNDDMFAMIKRNDGSIAKIEIIPQEVRDIYKTAFEIDQKKIVDGAAIRQQYIDQSQSTNLFVASRKGSEISDLYFHAWENGLKTTYYMRTLPASTVEKSTGENADQNTDVEILENKDAVDL